MNVAHHIRRSLAHLLGRVSGRHWKILSVCIPTAFALNHLKFYRFAAQFVRGKRVGDIGCGSGYGCRSRQFSRCRNSSPPRPHR